QAALNRFLFDLLGPQDEIFLYRFDSRPELVQPWTTNRQTLSRALGSIQPRGGTAMYDTIAEAIPMAQSGTQRKKALVVISDGNDPSRQTRALELQQMIRETEVLVYAIGIDASGSQSYSAPQSGGTWQPPAIPPPFPGRRPPVVVTPPRPAPPPPSS